MDTNGVSHVAQGQAPVSVGVTSEGTPMEGGTWDSQVSWESRQLQRRRIVTVVLEMAHTLHLLSGHG